MWIRTSLFDFASAVDYYRTQPELADTGRNPGMNGFCFGGGVTWRSTEMIGDLKAAVPFYGGPPPLDQVSNINAAVLGVYSSDPNDFANANRDALDSALNAAVVHEFRVYPETRTTPSTMTPARPTTRSRRWRRGLTRRRG